MANIKEIAKRAGVSVTTVSRVLNGYPYVSEAKRKAVLDVVAKLNYTPNYNAVYLAKGKTNSIGIIVPFVNHPYFSAISQGIANAALHYNYRLVTCQTNYDPEEEMKALQLLQMRQLDGLIICSKTLDWNQIVPFTTYAPIVACEDTGHYTIPCVHINHYQGFTLGMQHLIEQGHRHIGYCIARRNSFNSIQRKQAYYDALTQIQEPIQSEWVFEGCMEIQDGVRVVREWLMMKERPTALLVSSDQVAAGIVIEARKQGVGVPEDLAVVGFDNHPISEIMDITTIEHPSIALGTNAFELLFNQIKVETSLSQNIELPIRLIKRYTT